MAVPAALALVALSALTLGACATRPAAPALSSPGAVLRWQARNEAGVYGYLVFRAEKPEGPFLRISTEIIHVALDGPEVGSYTYVDRDVEPGRTYYYTLDVVEDSGRKRRFSGVMSKTVSR